MSQPFLDRCHTNDPARGSIVTDDYEESLMRVFLAGATGALGSRLVAPLIERGHEVIGTFHTPGKDADLVRLGAQPVHLDLLDTIAVRDAVIAAAPDAIIHQVTALSGVRFGRNLDRTFAPTNALRTQGTDALLAAAKAAGVTRFIAQSFASLRYAREGSWVKSETDPLDPAPAASTRETNAAMRHLDDAVTRAGGIALRYGGFYGAADDGMITPVRKRQFPLVGDGAGVLSFIHLDDAAIATAHALDHGKPGVYHIVDDDPAPVREWLPVLAQALGATSPRQVPTWVARLVAGGAAVVMGTEARGASNAKARRELGWTPRYASWRDGFPATYARGCVSTRKTTRAAVSPGVSGRPGPSGPPPTPGTGSRA
jgi:2-alkyl-3-oxoalkanoate reductase